MWKSQGERSRLCGGCWSVLSQISEAYSSIDWQYGDGRYHVKGCFRSTTFQDILTLWHVAAPSATKKRTTPLCSSLLASIPNAGQNTLDYTYLQSNKETTAWTYAFSLCRSPKMVVSIRRLSTVLPSFARNVFYSGCSVFIWLPLALL